MPLRENHSDGLMVAGDDWSIVQDTGERKRIQNRIAQRTYRKKLKSRIESLEQWRDAAKPANVSTATQPRLESPAPDLGHYCNRTSQRTSKVGPVEPATNTSSQLEHLPSLGLNSLFDDDNNTLLPCPNPQSQVGPQSPMLEHAFLNEELVSSDIYTQHAEHGSVGLWESSSEEDHQANYDDTVSKSQANVYDPSSSTAMHPSSLSAESSPVHASSNSFRTGKSVLHLTAEGGHSKSVQRLLEMNADIYNQDLLGQTALHLAIQNSHKEVVEALLAPSDDLRSAGNRARRTTRNLTVFVNIRDNTGQTALHLAAATGQDAIVELLLKTDIDIESDDNQGCKALHLAGLKGDDKIVGLLLESGANINSTIGGS